MSGTAKTILWGVVLVLFGLPLLATFSGPLLNTALRSNAPAAGELTCNPAPLPDHICPANGNRLDEQRSQRATPPTSAAAEPQPYGPANGKVHPLPSVADAQPEAAGRASLPQIGETATGGPLGGLIAELPAIGPALSQGLKALPAAGAP